MRRLGRGLDDQANGTRYLGASICLKPAWGLEPPTSRAGTAHANEHQNARQPRTWATASRRFQASMNGAGARDCGLVTSTAAPRAINTIIEPYELIEMRPLRRLR